MCVQMVVYLCHPFLRPVVQLLVTLALSTFLDKVKCLLGELKHYRGSGDTSQPYNPAM